MARFPSINTLVVCVINHMMPHLSYIICTNPRSGSWLLAAGLEDTNVAGHPNEWMNDYDEQSFCNQWEIEFPIQDYEAYMLKIRETGIRGGIFGMKCLGLQMIHSMRKLQVIPKYQHMHAAEIMESIFPNLRYIRLKRKDMTRQTISYYRASITMEWFEMENSPPLLESKRKMPIYNEAELVRHEKLLVVLEDFWDEYFAKTNLKPMEIFYEDLDADYEGTLRSVMQYLEVEQAQTVPIAPPRFHKQADAISEDWVLRYTEYKKRNQ